MLRATTAGNGACALVDAAATRFDTWARRRRQRVLVPYIGTGGNDDQEQQGASHNAYRALIGAERIVIPKKSMSRPQGS